MTHPRSISPAGHLYALPEPVQADLVQLVGAVAGMSAAEKHEALTVLAEVAERFAADGIAHHRGAVALLGSVGAVVGSIHNSTTGAPTW